MQIQEAYPDHLKPWKRYQCQLSSVGSPWELLLIVVVESDRAILRMMGKL